MTLPRTLRAPLASAALITLAACGGGGDGPAPDLAPLLTTSPATTAEDTPVALAISGSDPEGHAVTFSLVTPPAHGTLSGTLPGVSYHPAANFHGQDEVVVEASDGTHAVRATIAVTVSAVADAPVAVDDALTAAEDATLTFPAADLVANDVDADGDALTVTAVGGASHCTVGLAGGVVTIQFPPDYAGPATFEYTVSDGTLTATGQVTLTVTPVNDPPVAIDDLATTLMSIPLGLTTATLVANDLDVDGDTLAVTGVGSATNGTVTLSGGTITFTPEAGFTGTGSFTYLVSDGTATDTGVVTVSILPLP